MRINDWSSNVCSSDLAEIVVIPLSGFPAIRGRSAGHADARRPVAGEAEARLRPVQPDAQSRRRDRHRRLRQIGRGACRESMGQSVYTSAGAETVKNKQNKSTEHQTDECTIRKH